MRAGRAWHRALRAWHRALRGARVVRPIRPIQGMLPSCGRCVAAFPLKPLDRRPSSVCRHLARRKAVPRPQGRVPDRGPPGARARLDVLAAGAARQLGCGRADRRGRAREGHGHGTCRRASARPQDPRLPVQAQEEHRRRRADTAAASRASRSRTSRWAPRRRRHRRAKAAPEKAPAAKAAEKAPPAKARAEKAPAAKAAPRKAPAKPRAKPATEAPATEQEA